MFLGDAFDRELGMLNVILLILLGAVLIFLETILVGGIWCAAGIGLCAWAVFLAYADFGIAGAVVSSAASVAVCVGAFLVWLYVIPKTKLGRKIYLSSAQQGRVLNGGFAELVGREGVARSVLMPTGKVEIDGKLFDARSEFPHIENGSRVKVVGSDTFGVLVKKI